MTQPSRLPGHSPNSGSARFSVELSSFGFFLLSELPLCRALVLPRDLPGALLPLPGAADVTTLSLTNPLAKPLPLPRPEEREFDKSLTVDANSSKLDRVDVKVRGVVVR